MARPRVSDRLSTPRETAALQNCADPVEPGVVVGDLDRDRIDVAEPDLARCKTFAAAMASTPAPQPTSSTVRGRRRFKQPVEMQETAARRAVMAGAEGEARLDLDPDVVRAEPSRDRGAP